LIISHFKDLVVITRSCYWKVRRLKAHIEDEHGLTTEIWTKLNMQITTAAIKTDSVGGPWHIRILKLNLKKTTVV